jgi:hypothetical protein
MQQCRMQASAVSGKFLTGRVCAFNHPSRSIAVQPNGLLLRIERGDPGCSIGAVFEVAAICGVHLFEQDQRQLAAHLALHREKMALLPKAVRGRAQGVKDDF